MGGSIVVWLTFCLTGLDSTKLVKLLNKAVECKLVKQEVSYSYEVSEYSVIIINSLIRIVDLSKLMVFIKLYFYSTR